MSREFYQLLRTYGGLSLEYIGLTEANFTATSGTAYTPPERGDFRRLNGARQIQLLADAPGVIETFQTSQAELFLPANTATFATNDAGNGRVFYVKNSGTGSILIKDYQGTLLWTVQEVGMIMVVGNEADMWDFYFKAENIYYNNSDSGLIADNVKDAIDELSATASVSASPGFTWGRSGNISSGSYLLNDTVPSNTTGRVIPLQSGTIEQVFIAIEIATTASFDIQKRVSGSWVTQSTVTITSSRIATINTSVAVALNDEIAIRVSPTTANNPKNPVLGVIIKGTIP